MPRDVSKAWLSSSQNAFIAQQDPQTNAKWSDRYGIAFGKKFRKVGNVESYLSYPKLKRTGRLLRGLKTRVSGDSIILYNNVPYAEEHETGKYSSKTVVRPPYTSGGAQGVITGGNIHARPFMKPSQGVLRSPYKLLNDKIKKIGW